MSDQTQLELAFIENEISPSKLGQYVMDWVVNKSLAQDADELAAALVAANKHYERKYNIKPSRAWIHSSQISEALAAVAVQLGISISVIERAYNLNHIWLSCGDPFNQGDDDHVQAGHTISNSSSNQKSITIPGSN